MDNLTFYCFLIGTNLASFIVGIYSKAASNYLGQKLTDKRKKQENKNFIENKYRLLQKLFPGLIEEIKQDILSDESKIARIFIILSTRGVCYNGNGNTLFIYYEDEHDNLNNKIAMLEEYGFVVKDIKTNIQHYRFTEEFINLLKK